MGARNEMGDLSDETVEVKRDWEQQGKHWDVNPPLASHFGGVWERAIGQVRQIIDGYLLPMEQRLLSREEFHTMLLHSAQIVNSTPLHDPPENPNDPQPITPQSLITQRDDECRGSYTRPTIFTQDDLMAYGANRWKRVEALADEFAKYWKHYMYQIGDTLKKWTTPQNNARIGDMVLMRDKNLPRLEWSTGTIITVMPDKDKLVRRVIVQPHKKPGQDSAPSAKERAIHDLVLLKAFTMMDNPPPDTTKIPSAPKEATIMMTHHRILDQKSVSYTHLTLPTNREV